MRHLLCAALAALAIAAPAGARAQAYPAKPIHFVIGFPPGSSIDVISRIVLDGIRERSGASIVVENKPGALGALGVETVAKAAPDGYTMMPSSSATNASGPHLIRALGRFDAARDFTHLARMVSFDIALVTNAAQGPRDLRALLDKAKAAPDALTYGYGSGTGRVAAASFCRAAGIQVRGVPYKGQPPAVTDLIGGQIDFVAADLGALLPQVRAKKLTAVAVLSDKRSTFLPDAPTAVELGLRGAVLVGWIGVSGPAKLPPDVVRWWTEQLRATLAAPEIQARIREQAMDPAPLAGEPFRDFVLAEYERWGRHVTDSGIPVE